MDPDQENIILRQNIYELQQQLHQAYKRINQLTGKYINDQRKSVGDNPIN